MHPGRCRRVFLLPEDRSLSDLRCRVAESMLELLSFSLFSSSVVLFASMYKRFPLTVNAAPERSESSQTDSPNEKVMKSLPLR